MSKALVNPVHLVNALHPHRAVEEEIVPTPNFVDADDQGPEEVVIEKVAAPKKPKVVKAKKEEAPVETEKEEAADPEQKEEDPSEKQDEA